MSLATFGTQIIQDTRYALRIMVKNKTFTILAVILLALGIGANAALYSLIDTMLLRSLPVADPGSLVILNWHGKARGPRPKGVPGPTTVMHSGINTTGSTYNDPTTAFTGGVFPWAAVELFQKNDSVFSSVFAYYHYFLGDLNIMIRGQADTVSGQYVSGDYFSGLGIVPVGGRLIGPADDVAGASSVVVVNFRFSQRRFGGPENAIGQSILINEVPYTVIGVTPPQFSGVDPEANPDLFLPLHANLMLEADNPMGPVGARYLDQNFYWLEVMARLRPGVTLREAQAKLEGPFRQWVTSTATSDIERSDLPSLVVKEGGGGIDSLRRQYSKPLYMVGALTALILMLACANVANLLLARAAARQREIALRLSLGANRSRILRQLLTESVLLACVGGAIGIILARWGIQLLAALLAKLNSNFTLHPNLNWHVVLVAAGLSLITGVLFGIAPALQSTRIDVMPTLKDSSGTAPSLGRRHSRLSTSQSLVVAQITVTFLMLVAAGLFVRTLSNVRSIQLGFNSDNVLMFTLDARKVGHHAPEIYDLYSDLRQQFSNIPGAVNVSLANRPLIGKGTVFTDVSSSTAGHSVFSDLLTVGSDFFSTMRIPLILGREIDDRDRLSGSLVAVVNQAFVKNSFGDQNPIGQHISFMTRSAGKRELEIVGVAGNARYGSLKGDFHPIVYIPLSQGSFPAEDHMVYELRTQQNPLPYVSQIRGIVHNVDARMPVSDVKTLNSQITETIGQEITFAQLCTAFAGLALVIACVGLYAMMAHNLARRTSEIGVRMALGATRGNVIWIVLREVLILLALGVVIGFPTAFGISKFVSSFLFGIKANDPLTLTLAVGILFLTAFLAGYFPARKASKVDPIIALRHT